MKPRIDITKYMKSASVQAMLKLSHTVEASGLERPLLELVKIRASQINGCAYCIDMHTKDARVLGETEQRIYALNAWRETPFFTPRERAALSWTGPDVRGGGHQRVESPGDLVASGGGHVSGASGGGVGSRAAGRGRASVLASEIRIPTGNPNLLAMS